VRQRFSVIVIAPGRAIASCRWFFPNCEFMSERKYPRPPSVSLAGFLLVAYGFILVFSSTIFLNETVGGLTNWELAFAIALPCFALLSGWLILRGANWWRIIYWVGAVGYLVRLVVLGLYRPILLVQAVFLLAMAVLLALPAAHWFFTRRDYRRRPGYRAHFDKQENAGDRERRKKFEY
jgi:hypothetical protein